MVENPESRHYTPEERSRFRTNFKTVAGHLSDEQVLSIMRIVRACCDIKIINDREFIINSERELGEMGMLKPHRQAAAILAYSVDQSEWDEKLDKPTDIS